MGTNGLTASHVRWVKDNRVMKRRCSAKPVLIAISGRLPSTNCFEYFIEAVDLRHELYSRHEYFITAVPVSTLKTETAIVIRSVKKT